MSQSPTKIHLIVSPFHVGILRHRAGAGPDFLLKHGIVEKLRSKGKDVIVVTIPSVDDFEGEIGRSFEVIRRVSAAVTAAQVAGAFPLLLSGNCNNTVGVVSGLSHGNEADLVWFDAHPDFDTPEETLSGYFDVNGVSILAGQGWKAFAASVPGYKPIDIRKFRYVGLRDFDYETQREKVKASGAQVVWGGSDTPVEGFATALEKTFDVAKPQEPCVVHFDVDSLDTSVGVANHAAAPGGLTKDDAVDSIRVVKQKRRPISMTVASFDPNYEGADNIADAAIAAVLEVVS